MIIQSKDSLGVAAQNEQIACHILSPRNHSCKPLVIKCLQINRQLMPSWCCVRLCTVCTVVCEESILQKWISSLSLFIDADPGFSVYYSSLNFIYEHWLNPETHRPCFDLWKVVACTQWTTWWARIMVERKDRPGRDRMRSDFSPRRIQKKRADQQAEPSLHPSASSNKDAARICPIMVSALKNEDVKWYWHNYSTRTPIGQADCVIGAYATYGRQVFIRLDGAGISPGVGKKNGRTNKQSPRSTLPKQLRRRCLGPPSSSFRFGLPISQWILKLLYHAKASFAITYFAYFNIMQNTSVTFAI